MAHKFRLNPESLRRRFSVYVVVARLDGDIRLYVGKTGDNREGCNPMISRCGNHFSYNKIHSQIRNKIPNHEEREYIYIFEHFDSYHSERPKRQEAIDRINEMERWLNQQVQTAVAGVRGCKLLNPYYGTASVSRSESEKRKSFRTAEMEKKIKSILEELRGELNIAAVEEPA